VVAPVAGELISEIAVAMAGGLKLPALASVMHPYPSYSLVSREGIR
jgi:pyruvate/2-oxoglutarate dehydrogenase complex dihydrolipoamide dehydrogenase (E3) component